MQWSRASNPETISPESYVNGGREQKPYPSFRKRLLDPHRPCPCKGSTQRQRTAVIRRRMPSSMDFGCLKNEPCKECRGADAPKFRRCGKCKVVRYCSVECQRKNWPVHKLRCNSWTDEEKREEVEAYEYYQREGLMPSIHMSAVTPLLQKWIEAYRPLMVVAALNAWGFVGSDVQCHCPKVLAIDVVAAPGISSTTKAARAFLIKDAKVYHVLDFEQRVQQETCREERESCQTLLDDLRLQTVQMRLMNPGAEDIVRTSMVTVTLDFYNGVFRHMFYKCFYFTDDVHRPYTDSAWMETNWLEFLKTNVAAGKAWTREGISF